MNPALLRTVVGLLKSPFFWLPVVGAGGLAVLALRKRSGPAPIPVRDVEVTYLTTASDRIAVWMEAILRLAAAEAGVDNLTITSTNRSAYDQARIMYDQVEREGAAYARNLYGKSGDVVVNAIEGVQKLVNSKLLTRAQALKQIEAIVQSQVAAGGIVSRHMKNSLSQAVDISPKQMTGKATKEEAAVDPRLLRFVELLRANPAVRKVIPPPGDPAVHVEFNFSARPGTSGLSGLAPRRLGWSSRLGSRVLTPEQAGIDPAELAAE